jgi:hypothetical protein
MRTRLRGGGSRWGCQGRVIWDRVATCATSGAAESEDGVSETSCSLIGCRQVERILERNAVMCPRAVAGVWGRLRRSIKAVRSG